MSTSAHNKRIVIIAGPNGAGKTTSAREFMSCMITSKDLRPKPLAISPA